VSQVVRYFHIRNFNPNAKRSKFNAATVRVEGNLNYVGQVDVQVAYCSKEDQFSRAKGREVANKATPKVMTLYNLPLELAKIDELVMGEECPKDFYAFGIRYFLPKELA
jgi:hypothetical protein